MALSLTDVWTARAALKEAIRGFFGERGYLELDTPIAVVCPGTEVHLGYFATAWRDLGDAPHPLFLRSSPELHLKQALSLGVERVFELARCFRSGGELSPWHHPEFTMLEYYEAGIGFDAFIELTAELLNDAVKRLSAKKIKIAPTFRFSQPIERLSVAEAFTRFAGLTLVDEDPDLAAKAQKAGVVSIQPGDDFETAFFKILIEKIEPGLAALGAAVLCDYPPSQAALSRIVGGVAKRFEIYLGRVELCNGFYELLDPQENKRRMQAAQARRLELGLPQVGEDSHFYAALERGIPTSCGNALGFDRLLALLLGEPSLDRVIPFRRADPYALDPYFNP